MKILIGLIMLHFLVILVSRKWGSEKIPYTFIAIITAIMVGFVFYMMGLIERPEL